MNQPLWKPNTDYAKRSQMTQFREFVNIQYDLSLSNYTDLHRWSVENIPQFWEAAWNFFDIISSEFFSKVVDDHTKMPGAQWFEGSRLNFAENLLRFNDNHSAIIFRGENVGTKQKSRVFYGKKNRTITYAELYDEATKTAAALKNIGVKKGDRVVGFMPNIPETVIAMLATASLGAIWSSCSPDFGIRGVLDRFSQIKPKVLFAAYGYVYNGKNFNSVEKLKSILRQLPSIQRVVIAPYGEKTSISDLPNSVIWEDFTEFKSIPHLSFEQLPFDHPLYIMYSSGTTGQPKSIVHSAGGTLIQHLKELRLHTDLTREDMIFYFTTCGWMMWNWLVSSLAAGATIVLYDGSPIYPDGRVLWQMAEELGITVFGTSAKYISSCVAAEIKPQNQFNLTKLRAILSTGSPLSEESFDYVYRDVKKDIMLSSIAGGTDIISCFVLGNPTLPVYRGEIQCAGLGMDIEAFNDQGESVKGESGELVCKSSFPSMPVSFWNDTDDNTYKNAYFSTFSGVWHHGDYITITEVGGIKMHGRSDATLNPGGVRIGTAEIYRVVEAIPEIDDSIVVGQRWKDDERIILFVKINDNGQLSNLLIDKIKDAIKTQCSPRHIPAKILAVSDIPYTINGKKVEIAVKKIIHGERVTNKDALANPSILNQYQNLSQLRY